MWFVCWRYRSVCVCIMQAWRRTGWQYSREDRSTWCCRRSTYCRVLDAIADRTAVTRTASTAPGGSSGGSGLWWRLFQTHATLCSSSNSNEMWTVVNWSHICLCFVFYVLPLWRRPHNIGLQIWCADRLRRVLSKNSKLGDKEGVA